jgi:hypothetical protein
MVGIVTGVSRFTDGIHGESYQNCSVRIQSQKLYTGGLFILDTNHAPWGCGKILVAKLVVLSNKHVSQAFGQRRFIKFSA